jgi:hypothetical protein
MTPQTVEVLDHSLVDSELEGSQLHAVAGVERPQQKLVKHVPAAIGTLINFS